MNWLPPGRHVLVLHYPDGQSVSRELDIEAGSLVEVDGASLNPMNVVADANAAVVAANPGPPPPPIGKTSTTRDQASSTTVDAEGGRWTLVVRADIDGTGRGGVGAAGVTAALLRPLRASAGVMVGARAGAWFGLEASARIGSWRPTLGASVPTFYESGIYPGLGGELGLRYEGDWYVSPFARVAVVHFVNRPEGFVATVLVPSVGVEVPL